MRSAVPLAVAAFLLVHPTGSVRAQDLAPERRLELAEKCRGLLLRFMDAVNAGDGRTLDQLIYVRNDGVAQGRGRTAVIKCIEQQRALERAAAARWGTDAAREFGGAFMSFTAADRTAVEKARIDVRVDEVHVITGPNVAPIVVRRNRTDGQWQVVLRVVSLMVDVGGTGRQAEESTPTRLKYLERVQQALSDVARRVSEKRVDTAAAARKELDDLMKRVAEQKEPAAP